MYLEQAIILEENLGEIGELENMYFQHGNHLKDLKQYDQALIVSKRTLHLVSE